MTQSETEVEAAKRKVLAAYPKAEAMRTTTYEHKMWYVSTPAQGHQVGGRLSDYRLTEDGAWVSAARHPYVAKKEVYNPELDDLDDPASVYTAFPPHPPVIDTREAVVTAKEKVLAVHDQAECFNIGNQYCGIFANCEDEKHIGSGFTEDAAWLDAASRLPAPALSQPVESAQVESGDGLPPLDKEYELEMERVRSFSTMPNGPLELRLRAESRERQLQSALTEIERLKGLLRECGQSPYLHEHLRERIKAAVTGE